MRRICLVDDDILVRDALALGLGDSGYDVAVAPGAAAGLDLMMRERVDALVTDINMPGTDGAELIIQVRARWPAMAIIAISGAALINGRALSDAARSLGADAVMVKPFRARQLAGLIDSLLDSRAEHAG